MNEYVNIERAKEIMGSNFIGPIELGQINEFRLNLTKVKDIIPFNEACLKEKSQDYYLVCGVSEFENGDPVNIKNLKSIFGMNPEEKTPCFYFQDWYEKEEFIDLAMTEEWFFIRKNVFEDSRAVQPEELLKKFSFPTAIKCTYVFFVVWLTKNEKLWYHDFVWCSDIDHNGDRIYVGKYNDIDGVNRDGFSIHRHLALRNCYGCIE